MTPEQVADLIERLEKADAELNAMGRNAPTTPYAGGIRFKGKAEGVRLALSYVREYVRS